MMAGGDMLTIRDLRTHFFAPHGVVRAVDGVDLVVRDGETVAIVGESGSGKSMTALSILRLVPSPGRVVGGSVAFAGRDLLALDERALRRLRASEIAMIFQDAGSYLNPIMPIGEQIAEAFGRRGSRRPEDRARVLQALADVRIADPARVAAGHAHELSGGMQQRVMIAAALARRPRLLIADEPTTALDATVQREILDLLRDLRARNNLSLLLISHDLAVVADICERVYVMYAGQVVESGPTRETLRAPNHPYTRALADAILDPWEPRREIRPLDGDPPDMAAPPTGCRFHPRCPAVMDACRGRQPTTLSPAPGRSVACWLHAAREAVP
jgi:oligopeptide/dipeptide ABC transporter ATP-binding protein